MLDFFVYGDDYIGRWGGIFGVKEVDYEWLVGRLVGGGFKVGEGVFGGVVVFFGNGEDGNEDGKDVGEGLEYGKGL